MNLGDYCWISQYYFMAYFVINSFRISYHKANINLIYQNIWRQNMLRTNGLPFSQYLVNCINFSFEKLEMRQYTLPKSLYLNNSAYKVLCLNFLLTIRVFLNLKYTHYTLLYIEAVACATVRTLNIKRNQFSSKFKVLTNFFQNNSKC